MTGPDPRALAAALQATWPAASSRQVGPFTLRDGGGGGQRVASTTVEGPFTPAELDAALDAMQASGQPPIFQIGPGAEALDAALAQRGWRMHDPVSIYLCPIAPLAVPPPRVSAFAIWPPLAIQRDLWAEGHIGPGRVAVMERVAGPHTSILGRRKDRAAGTAFVALDGDVAVLHALHVLPDFRRMGVARAIMQQAAVWAQAEGARWLALAVTQANGAGNGLYASLGMEIVEQYHYRVPGEGKT